MYYLFQNYDYSFSVYGRDGDKPTPPPDTEFKKIVKIPDLFKHKNPRNSFFYYDDERYSDFSMLVLALIMLENFPDYNPYFLLDKVLLDEEINEIRRFTGDNVLSN